MTVVLIYKLICQWCQKENDFGKEGFRHGPAEEDASTSFTCKECGNKNQVENFMTVKKYQPIERRPTTRQQLKGGADVILGGGIVK